MNKWTLPPVPFPINKPLVIGVSGGSDSLGLLLLLLEQLPNASRRLIVAHVNYGLRGRESDHDEKAVQRISAENHLIFERLQVARFNPKSKKKSPQDLAREIRYSFFQKLVQKHKAWGVAVAHHLEDQAETVLDRLLRGAGTRGLSGLRPVQTLNIGGNGRPLRVWRPLLPYSKEQLREFLKSRNFYWREDLSNQTNQYRRNQIRNQVVPFLSKWNPNLMEVLSHVGEIMTAEDLFLESLMGPLEKKLKSRWAGRVYSCDASQFKKISLALQRRWIRHVAEQLTTEARGLHFERIEETIRLWEGREKGPRDLGFGLSAGCASTQAFLRKK